MKGWDGSPCMQACKNTYVMPNQVGNEDCNIYVAAPNEIKAYGMRCDLTFSEHPPSHHEDLKQMKEITHCRRLPPLQPGQGSCDAASPCPSSPTALHFPLLALLLDE